MTSPSKDQYLESLRLSSEEFATLVALTDSSPCRVAGTPQRRHERVLPDADFRLLLDVRFPNGSTARFRIQPKDVSESGLGYFHKSFVHPSSTCTFTGRTVDNQRVVLTGRVVRCRHVRGAVHEVGVEFDGPIELGTFVSRFARPAVENDTSIKPLDRDRLTTLVCELRDLAAGQSQREALLNKALLIIAELSQSCDRGPESADPQTP